MTCAKLSWYQEAHSQLAAAFPELTRRASAPYKDKNVPSHLTTEKVGDALINLSGEAKQLVLDFSITLCILCVLCVVGTHPVLGERSANGTMRWNNKVLAQKAKDKWNKHGSNYNVIGYAFVQCVTTTYGQIHGHLLRLLCVLAKKQAETVHVHK
jgi:hypothetical protein